VFVVVVDWSVLDLVIVGFLPHVYGSANCGHIEKSFNFVKRGIWDLVCEGNVPLSIGLNNTSRCVSVYLRTPSIGLNVCLSNILWYVCVYLSTVPGTHLQFFADCSTLFSIGL
jgi:hypothetical protein